ncbi:tubulin [Capsaspora owczarzaki ATCC 30864]|uniref:Tubulin n=1 Tax=Capsaspora owczarzaki (strain ATCC 30864) TaxID=595528 RepID=A0A0D2X0X5_CAPO3|nr:tubulin [Capsaspora owczarzaki ATCC 30864]KJE89819.1 tubulin [Capsaspora owczarzaki ATCC 30864]|eukprot:XP_004349760.2 tubulin [Capsaspora owczarzaki ATCC 30864]
MSSATRASRTPPNHRPSQPPPQTASTTLSASLSSSRSQLSSTGGPSSSSSPMLRQSATRSNAVSGSPPAGARAQTQLASTMSPTSSGVPNSSSSGAAKSDSAPSLVEHLCATLVGPKAADRPTLVQYALRILASRITAPTSQDEFFTAEIIKKRFTRQQRTDDALRFAELFQKLGTKSVIQNKWAILYFLLSLSEESAARNASLLHASKDSILLSTSGLPVVQLPSVDQISSALLPTVASASSLAGSGSIETKAESSPLDNMALSQASIDRIHATRAIQAAELRSTSLGGLDEQVLLHDVLFAFQGIDGQYIKWNAILDRFTVDDRLAIAPPVHELVLKLVDLGWLFSKVQEFVQQCSAAPGSQGLLVQAFASALHLELTEFYRLVALLDSHVGHQTTEGNSSSPGLTLRRLAVWTVDPMERMRVLAALVDMCRGLRGGALVTRVHALSAHGDPLVQRTVKKLTNQLMVPIRAMLHRWLFDGELDDPHGEFFICVRPNVPNDRMWHDRYAVREAMMIEHVIPATLVHQILLIGKSINFLRSRAHDRDVEEQIHALKMATPVSTFEDDAKVIATTEALYAQTSRRVIDVMLQRYHLLDHLSAIRKFLLLGQGDFAQHLMFLTHEELAKPAASLYVHNLAGILESAVRATNAQYEPTAQLNRLGVKMLEVSPGDVGWDVFTLDYAIEHPLDLILSPAAMSRYLQLFHFLWRLKRIDFSLSTLWKELIVDFKQFKSMPEVMPVFQKFRVVANEMIHFVRQLHYYLLYEILECSWGELQRAIRQARDFDQLIAAHDKFLNSILAGALLSGSSQVTLGKLRGLLDLVLDFQQLHAALFQAADDELHRRAQSAEVAAAHTREGRWGTTTAEASSEAAHVAQFIQGPLEGASDQVSIIGATFKKLVIDFGVLLGATETNLPLKFLAVRIDFNEHYRRAGLQLYSDSAAAASAST